MLIHPNLDLIFRKLKLIILDDIIFVNRKFSMGSYFVILSDILDSILIMSSDLIL